jgi:hypothetical protein
MNYRVSRSRRARFPSGGWVAQIQHSEGQLLSVAGHLSDYFDTMVSTTRDGAIQTAQKAIDAGR